MRLPSPVDDQRIDLDQARVTFAEQPVEFLADIDELPSLLLGVQPESVAELARLVRLEAGRGMHGDGQNLLRRVSQPPPRCPCRRPPRRGSRSAGASGPTSIERYSSRSMLTADSTKTQVDRQAFAAGLFRLEPLADHRRRGGANLIGALRELHPARLAATAGMNLRLDDPETAAQPVRCRNGLGRASRPPHRARWESGTGRTAAWTDIREDSSGHSAIQRGIVREAHV